MKLLVIHGPNLNMLGVREQDVYGQQTMEQINQRLRDVAVELGGIDLEFFHSNHEGEIIDRIQAGHGQALDGGIINPGGLGHTSISLHDALKAVDYPFIEVHISNIYQRESWREHSVVAAAARGTIVGLGPYGYEAALRALAHAHH